MFYNKQTAYNLYVVQLMGAMSMQVDQLEEGRWKGLLIDKVDPKKSASIRLS